MREANQATLGAIGRDTGGVAIVWYPDLGMRQWVMDDVSSLLDIGVVPLRIDSLEEALQAPDRLVLWAPADEAAAVLELDGSRDRLRNPERPRTQPLVLFLMRNGDGARVLDSEATSLSSIVAGNCVDPEELSEVNVPAERAQFQRVEGKSPEQWLEAWRRGMVEPTSQSIATSYRAKLLEAK